MIKAIAIVIAVAVIASLTGCSTWEKRNADGSYELQSSNNFFGKQVHAEGTTYGFEASGPDTQTPTAAVKIGIVQGSLDTIPVEKGQPFKISRKTGSVWNSNAITETIIEVGAAPYSGILRCEANNTLFGNSISANYISDTQKTVSNDIGRGK